MEFLAWSCTGSGIKLSFFIIDASLPAGLITIAIAYIVAITVAIALVATNCLPPLLPSLFPPKPSLSSLHSTLVADNIALFATLALFITSHPYLRCHYLASLAFFVTCSHC
jgi:hypothetical protein